MDAVFLLQADHQTIRNYFERIRAAEHLKDVRALFQGLRDELNLHTRVEETFFYPLFRSRRGFETLVDESYQDHQEIRDILTEIDDMPARSTEIVDRILSLQHRVDLHLQKEETDFLARVRDACTPDELEELGRQMEEMKNHERPRIHQEAA